MSSASQVFAELGLLAHQAEHAGVAGVQAADAHPERVAPRRLARVIARQDDARAEEDGAAVELAQALGLDFDELDLLGVGGQLLGRDLLRQLQLPVAAMRGVEVNLLRLAVEVARRTAASAGRRCSRTMPGQSSRRPASAERLVMREGEGSLVEHGDCARGEGAHVTRQGLRRIEAGAAEREARLGIVRPGEDDEQPAIFGCGGQALVDGDLELPRGPGSANSPRAPPEARGRAGNGAAALIIIHEAASGFSSRAGPRRHETLDDQDGSREQHHGADQVGQGGRVGAAGPWRTRARGCARGCRRPGRRRWSRLARERA